MTDSRDLSKIHSLKELWDLRDVKEGRKKKEERSELHCKDCRHFLIDTMFKNHTSAIGYCKKYAWFVRDDVAALGCEGFEKRR